MSQHMTDHIYVSTSTLYSATTQTVGNHNKAHLQKSYSYSSKNCRLSTVREKLENCNLNYITPSEKNFTNLQGKNSMQ